VQEKTLLSDAEWKEFQGQIDEIFPGFISRLKKLNHLLTDQDISFCCLVRLEFKYSDIASVFGCTPQAITKRKKRIFNQLGVDSTHAFEKFLKNL
jgi:DNA-directed RNA polymerase specialized sigma24 family protein